jgi:hypothetical protein
MSDDAAVSHIRTAVALAFGKNALEQAFACAALSRKKLTYPPVASASFHALWQRKRKSELLRDDRRGPSEVFWPAGSKETHSPHLRRGGVSSHVAIPCIQLGALCERGSDCLHKIHAVFLIPQMTFRNLVLYQKNDAVC